MAKSAPQPSAQFPAPEDLGPRDWGTETLLFAIPGKLMLKRIEMKAGTKGGLQYHHKRDEGGVIIEGEAWVVYDRGDGLHSRFLGAGDIFVFPCGAVHQIQAHTDCVYVEASTPYLNDRVRVDNEPGGLPSTKLEDVVSL
jgi:mannose-6-phosphate isomerase